MGKKKLILCLLVISNMISIKLISQKYSYTPVAAVPSANSISLGTFGEIPVSLHTGLPEINVPLYEFNAGNLTIPVSLSYHAAGVKVNEHPGWVGLNWALQAGGQISRVQKGICDEKNYGVSQSITGIDRGYYGTHNRNNFSYWADNSYLGSDPGSTGGDFQYDSEPDEFHFSYPGNSGKFFLDEAGEWRVQSNKAVKIKFDPVDIGYAFDGLVTSYASVMVFKKFAIIDELGNQYIYGESANAIEYSDTYITEFDAVSATSWQLTKIISYNGLDVIEFNYERGPAQAFLYAELYQKTVLVSGSAVCGASVNSYGNSFPDIQRGNAISPVYLKSIRYPRGDLKIEFLTSKSTELSYSEDQLRKIHVGLYKDANQSNTASPPAEINGQMVVLNPNLIPYYQSNTYPTNYWERFIWLKLDKVKITNEATSGALKTIFLTYDNTSSERLRLKYVEYKTGTEDDVSKYQFNYDNQTLPDYLASMGDHWGYNCNAPSVWYIINHAAYSSVYSYREPDLTKAQAGILKEIIYPTGGKTTFNYQLNHCAKFVDPYSRNTFISHNSDVGGLRIWKTITTDNNTNTDIVKEYYYVKGYDYNLNPSTLESSGILDTYPVYSLTSISVGGMGGAPVNYSAFSTRPNIPLSQNSKGQFIGYSEVVEKLSDGSYTIFKYTNHDNGYNDENSQNSYNGVWKMTLPPTSRDFERGNLLEKLSYSNTGTPVSSEIYEYDRIGTISLQSAKAIAVGLEEFCSIPPPELDYTHDILSGGYFYRTAYLKYYYPFFTKKITTKITEQNNPTNYIQTVKEYSYDGNKNLTQEKITTSNSNRVLKTTYTYPYNYPSDPVLNAMTFKNRITPIIEKKIINDVSSTELSVTKTNYSLLNLAGGDFIEPSSIQTSFRGNSLETEQYISNYDANSNVVQVTGRDGITTSYQWGYKGVYPEAKIVNAKNSFRNYYTPLVQNPQINIPNGSLTTINYPFNQYFVGNITTSMTFNGAPGGSAVVKVLCTLVPGVSQILCISTTGVCTSSGYPSSFTFTNVQPGSYTLNLTIIENSSSPGARINFNFNDRQAATSGIKEFFYQGFEEDPTASTSSPYAGLKSYASNNGDYAVNFSLPNSRDYNINYHYLDNGVWKNMTKRYTGNTTLTEGTAIDEVRIYPVGSYITTYTYSPLIGMTSQTDPNGRTTFYEYDAFQRIKLIRDQDKNIIKVLDYKYQQTP